MPRQKNIQRPIGVYIKLPEDLYTKVALHVFSPFEGRIPRGKLSGFFIDRINEYFAKAQEAKEHDPLT